MLVIIMNIYVTASKHFKDKSCNTSSMVLNKQHSPQTKLSISRSKNTYFSWLEDWN
jgi:hypothetical protein